MGAISLSSLAGLTVTYNSVQFGGGDSSYKSTPPIYDVVGNFVWDDARTSIKGTRYQLTVRTVFYEDSEAAMAANMESLRLALSTPSRELLIQGIGAGFDLTGSTPMDDIEWGPRPLELQMTPLAQKTWQLVWTVEWMVKECDSLNLNPLAFTAFNFSTSWSNDFEGMCTRRISGYVEIAIRRVRSGSGFVKVPRYVADNVRDRINIVVPVGFRRVSNDWQELDAKNRLNFTVVDEFLPGDYLPEGCTAADGFESFDSVGPGFAQAQVTLQMNLRTAPDKPKGLAGITFLTAAITKQNQMANALNAGGKKGTVIASSLHISNGKFDRARDTSCSMSWVLTRCLNDMMKAAGIWEPAVQGSYELWRTSIQHLWGNRGLTYQGIGPGSIAREAVVIDLCDNVTSVTIGSSPSPGVQTINAQLPIFSCPNVPEDGGWMGHELKLRILRHDESTNHKKAEIYLPEPGYIAGGSQDADRVPIGGFPYQQTQNQKHDVEYHGFPVVYILLEFKGLRFVRKPMMPQLKSVAGIPVEMVAQEIDGPRWAFDVLVCPAWFIRGWRIYRVNGYVPDVRVVESETSCAAPNVSQEM